MTVSGRDVAIGRMSGDGCSWRDLHDTSDAINKQLVLVPSVRKVVIDGEQREVAYLEVSRSRLAKLGIDLRQIADVPGSQNVVVNSANVQLGDDYLRISPTGNFKSVQEIGDLLISANDKTLVRLSDFATINRAYEEVPVKYYCVNGKPGLSMGISMAAGENVVKVGKSREYAPVS